MRAAWATIRHARRALLDERFREFENFDDLLSSAEQDAALTITRAGTNAAATAATPSSIYGLHRRGLIQMSTGTTSTGRVTTSFGSSTQPVVVLTEGVLTIAESEIYVDALSDGSQTFTIVGCGLVGDASVASPSSGVAIRYTHGTHSGSWHLYASNGGVSTTIGSVPAVAVGWHRLRLEVHGEVGMVRGFVNGVEILSFANLSYLPTTGVGFAAGIHKGAGSTARTCVIDWVRFRHRMRLVDRVAA